MKTLYYLRLLPRTDHDKNTEILTLRAKLTLGDAGITVGVAGLVGDAGRGDPGLVRILLNFAVELHKARVRVR